MMSGTRAIEGHVPITLATRYRLILPAAPTPAAGYPFVLALHGQGDDADRLLDRLPEPGDGPFAWLVPDAPYPVELRTETPPRIGYAWYQYTGDQVVFRQAIDFALDHLERLIAVVAVEHGLDRTRCAVLGYSQGGYVAGMMALLHPQRLCAFVAIACRIKVESVADLGRLGELPVLVVHGERDPVVALDRQLESVDILRQHGVAVTVHTHPGGHGLRREVGAPIDRFLREALTT